MLRLTVIFGIIFGLTSATAFAGKVTDRADVKKAVKSGKYTEIVTTKGKGAAAVAGKKVNVHYTGWLKDGKKFDSSKDRNQPFSFNLGGGQVIKGWDKGVVGMKPGETKILVIPSELAYGSRSVGNGLIPANSTLVFEVSYLGPAK